MSGKTLLNRALGCVNIPLSVFIPFGFNKLRLHRIEADVDPHNLASISLLEYFGFKREGYLRERYYMNDEFQDAIFYALLKSEFDKQNP